jgi:hypothetical protein
MMLLILLCVLAIYLRSLKGEFLTDDFAILDMEEIHGKFRPRYRYLRSFFSDPRWVTHLSYQLTWQLAGFRPWAWHAGNVLIHTGNCLLLYWFFSLLRLPHIHLAVATFALHPLQVPAVAWISGRAGMLAAGFSYLAWILLLTGYWPLAFVAQLLAVKSKQDGWLYIGLWPLIVAL